MKRRPNIEDAETVEIGRTYWVPCVTSNKDVTGFQGATVPLLGPLHDDLEVIGFREKHWHVDWRFAGARLMGYVGPFDAWNENEIPFGKIISEKNVNSKVTRKLLTCLRQYHGEFPVTTWTGRLEDAFADKPLRNFICPHRGVSLRNLPTKADGTIVCPGHGLQFNVNTCELVRRCHFCKNCGKPGMSRKDALCLDCEPKQLTADEEAMLAQVRRVFGQPIRKSIDSEEKIIVR